MSAAGFLWLCVVLLPMWILQIRLGLRIVHALEEIAAALKTTATEESKKIGF